MIGERLTIRSNWVVRDQYEKVYLLDTQTGETFVFTGLPGQLILFVRSRARLTGSPDETNIEAIAAYFHADEIKAIVRELISAEIFVSN